MADNNFADFIHIQQKVESITFSAGSTIRDLPEIKEYSTSLYAYYGKNFSTLPPELTEFKNLESIELKRCSGLNYVNAFKFIAKLPKLKWLFINSGGLKAVPREIGLLVNLKLLCFGNDEYCDTADKNSFETLPPEIGSLVNLEELMLCDMARTFKQLPIEIANLKRLKKIMLLNSTLPKNLDLIENLSELDLTDAYYDEIDLISLLKKRKSLRLLTFREGYVPRRLKDDFPDLEFDITPQPHDGFY